MKIQHHTWLILASISLIGIALRLYPAITTDFPLNDGGFPLMLIRELEENHYRLPAFTAYNQANIPFAYPPFGFYLTIIISKLSGTDYVTLLRLLPAIISALAIPAVFLFSREYFKTRIEEPWMVENLALLSAAGIALLPSSYYDLLISGGGITRAPGFLFAILTFWMALRLTIQKRFRYTLGCVILGSLTILSHPGAAYFVVISCMLGVISHKPSVKNISYLLLSGLGAVILSAPWWATVLNQHGLMPFLAAFSTPRAWPFWQPVLLWNWTNEPLFAIFAGLGLLGILWCLAQRNWFLVLWLGCSLILMGRAVELFGSLPLALLAALGWTFVISPGFSLRFRQIGFLWGIGYALLAALILPSLSDDSVRSLTFQERQALFWVQNSIPNQSRFIVITKDPVGHDPLLEWFPALTGRISLNTTQGYEWLAGAAEARIERYTLLQVCKFGLCLEDWAIQAKEEFDYVLLKIEDNLRLFASLSQDPGYTLVYESNEIAIYEHK